MRGAVGHSTNFHFHSDGIANHIVPFPYCIPMLIVVMVHCPAQVVDGVCALKGRLYTGDEAAVFLHKYDFEWLLEAVVKVLSDYFARMFSLWLCVV